MRSGLVSLCFLALQFVDVPNKASSVFGVSLLRDDICSAFHQRFCSIGPPKLLQYLGRNRVAGGNRVFEKRQGPASIVGFSKCSFEIPGLSARSEEHTSELQSLRHLVCRLLLEKKQK